MASVRTGAETNPIKVENVLVFVSHTFHDAGNKNGISFDLGLWENRAHLFSKFDSRFMAISYGAHCRSPDVPKLSVVELGGDDQTSVLLSLSACDWWYRLCCQVTI